MRIYGKSDIGKIRQTNQDCFFVDSLTNDAVLVIVCDGMGGANGGNVASELARNKIKTQILSSYKDLMESNSIRNLLIASTINANTLVYEKSKEDVELEGMGTTVVASIINKDMAHIVSVGDSRAYCIGKNGVVQITMDHSIVQEMVNSGEITEEEAKVHPQKNIITRAVGVKEDIDVDYNEIDTKDVEYFLFCTDGLTNYLSKDEIYNIFRKYENIDVLIDELIKRAKDLGGSDNITVVVIENNH